MSHNQKMGNQRESFSGNAPDEDADSLSFQKEDIKDFFLGKGVLQKRGYRVNKWVTLSGFLPFFVLFVLSVVQVGFGNHFYYVCDADKPKCQNPFYDECNEIYQSCVVDEEIRESVCAEYLGFCSLEYVPGGYELGTPPSTLSSFTGWAAFVGPLFSIFLNHVLYNRRFKWKNA